MLNVNELFVSVQGEGTFTGTPATFVRLQFCDVGCPWCDTKHTWDLHPPDRRDDLRELAEEVPLLVRWGRVSVDAVVQWVLAQEPRLVVITGGEPMAQDLGELVPALVDGGKAVQIETSGTYPLQDAAHHAWLTVSPKVDMPGGREVDHHVLRLADEIKHPVGKLRDVLKLEALLAAAGHCRAVAAGRVFLQPLSMSRNATKVCIAAATERGWRVSLQAHALAGLR